MQVFNPNQEYQVVYRKLPHWSQAGTLCFITWRTWDSMPSRVVSDWNRQRDDWLLLHGVDPRKPNWLSELAKADESWLGKYRSETSDRWNEHLDSCHGSCVLRRPDLAKIVADSLLHFDGNRYDLTDFVVMPNHVHILAAFRDEDGMLNQCESWKHFTATKINRLLQRTGRFWQQDDFDRLVRSVEQFEHLQRYISDNPKRAKLISGEYVHFSKPV
jgi:type I restriction enzyme R subunit